MDLSLNTCSIRINLAFKASFVNYSEKRHGSKPVYTAFSRVASPRYRGPATRPKQADLVPHNLACCYHMTGDTIKADAAFQKAIKENQNSGVYCEYGHFLFAQERYEEAIAQLKQAQAALACDRNKKELWYGLSAKSFAEIGIQKEIELVPDNGLIIDSALLSRYLLVAIYHRRGQILTKDGSEALNDFVEFVKKTDIQLAHRLLSYVHENMVNLSNAPSLAQPSSNESRSITPSVSSSLFAFQPPPPTPPRRGPFPRSPSIDQNDGESKKAISPQNPGIPVSSNRNFSWNQSQSFSPHQVAESNFTPKQISKVYGANLTILKKCKKKSECLYHVFHFENINNVQRNEIKSIIGKLSPVLLPYFPKDHLKKFELTLDKGTSEKLLVALKSILYLNDDILPVGLPLKTAPVVLSFLEQDMKKDTSDKESVSSSCGAIANNLGPAHK